MTKYCVKKPFTIFVAVIAVMVIGVVSLMRMKTDLLPDMSLPYLMIITTDPGASPEKVESEVTSPMEQALGTVTGVENITSVSAENYSMITLEFIEDTNMDSAMVKVTAKLNQLELPEMCGTPNMLEISMDMMATMYATVSYENKDIYEVSDFTEEIIRPYFERQDGVASVSAVGSVEKTVEVRLNASKIDQINDQILEETNDKLAEAKEQIEEAAAQLEDGTKKLDDAKSELEKKQDDLKKAQSDTSKQLAEASLALDQALATKAAYEANLTSLQASKAGLEAEKKAYEDNQVVDTYNKINGALGAMQTTLAQPAQLAGVTIPADIDDALANPEELAPFVEWISQMGMGDQVKDLTVDRLQQLSDIVTKRLPQIETGIANLETQIMAVEQAVKQVNQQMDQIDQKYKEADSGKFQAAVSMASGDAQMANGLSGIESSQKELDEAKKELKEAKKQYRQSRKAALEQANISSLVNMDTLSQMIYAQNFSMPAGYLGNADEDNQWLLHVGDNITSVDQLESLLLLSLPDEGAPPRVLRSGAPGFSWSEQTFALLGLSQRHRGSGDQRGQGQGGGYNEQGYEQLDEIFQNAEGVFVSRDTQGEHPLVEGDRFHPLDSQQHRAQNQRGGHRRQIGPDLPACAGALPLDDPNVHPSSSFPSRNRLSRAMPAGLSSYLLLRSSAPVIIRPSSSLLVLWAWTTPMTLP